ncbi:GGDEF domain-containing response regulator [Thermoanaerobacter wiegelii]|uniref:Stage 0 sporulation protein A homolog n=1 Tax=Thermoanaerobacter wiegelii Rt8.B1 TaxID=697303 RepID=G2MXY0_9THEO|nr:response regulator [Thermoanaerobacter wiegelii]AEM79728.1 response regulator receiver modulated diguanylate cyclase [Thermoanaerobacter wiegelii Rt8.B1]
MIPMNGVIEDILNTIKDLQEIKNKDKSYINVVESTLKNVYVIAKENNIEDVYLELKEIEDVLVKERAEIDDKVILEKLDRVKKALEEKVVERRRVIIFSDDSGRLRQLIKELNEMDINTIIGKSDIIDSIMTYYPNIVIIQNNRYINALTILKAIMEEKILNQIPIIIIGENNRDAKIESLKLGAVDYISCPFDIDEIILKINNLSNMSLKCLKNSIYDVATGLYTRKHGELFGDKLLSSLKNENKNGSLLLIDFDYMSEINEKMGVSFGNSVINEIVSEFKKYTTKMDVAYRISGDEFAILFYDRDVKWVKNATEKILEYAEKYGKNFGIEVSFSGGIVSIGKETRELKDAYLKAKEALSRAKAEGRRKILIDIGSLKENAIKNILFVDDDKIILSILTARYKSKGYNIYSVSDGTDALEIIKKNKIDLVVTDYYMKLMNGDELIKRIREQNKNIKIIVLSSQKNEDYIKRTLELGADDYVIKPFSPVELDSRIKKLLD